MLTSYYQYAFPRLKTFCIVSFACPLILILMSCDASQPAIDVDQDFTVIEDSPLVDSDKEIDAYRRWFSDLSAEEKDSLMTDLATFITRKPATAQNISKFDPMYRAYYVKKREELEFVCAQKIEGKLFFYLLREARDAKGVRQRGVGGVFEFGDKGKIVNFEELFNTRILEKDELERIGLGFMKVAKDPNLLNEFIADQTIIEWPDGRLFYSKEKYEWRYVD